MDPLGIIIFLAIGLAASTAGALMGVGGGFIMVPLFIFMGFNDNYGGYLIAPVLSLFVIIFVASSASVKNSREKFINYRLGLIYAPFSIIGAFVGAEILLLIDDFVFKIIFSGLIVIIGVRLILKQKNSNHGTEANPTEKKRSSYYWVIVWGFVTGLSASLVGIGGGLVAVPVLHLVFMETMHVAIGTSLFIMIFTASFSTLWNYLNLMSVLDSNFLFAGLLVAAGALIGSQIGSYIQTRLKGRTLQLTFGLFMIGIAIPLLWIKPFL